MKVKPGEVYRVDKTGKTLTVVDVWYDGPSDQINVTYRDDPKAMISLSSPETAFLEKCSLVYSELTNTGT